MYEVMRYVKHNCLRQTACNYMQEKHAFHLTVWRLAFFRITRVPQFLNHTERTTPSLQRPLLLVREILISYCEINNIFAQSAVEVLQKVACTIAVGL